MKSLALDEFDAEKRKVQRAKAREKRKEMERERKKAIRAAYRRVKEAKQKKDTDVCVNFLYLFIGIRYKN